MDVELAHRMMISAERCRLTRVKSVCNSVRSVYHSSRCVKIAGSY
jgi:hypothetical protein